LCWKKPLVGTSRIFSAAFHLLKVKLNKPQNGAMIVAHIIRNIRLLWNSLKMLKQKRKSQNTKLKMMKL
jgi:hypothetical protein